MDGALLTEGGKSILNAINTAPRLTPEEVEAIFNAGIARHRASSRNRNVIPITTENRSGKRR